MIYKRKGEMEFPLRINLQFFAEGEEKTEQPTQRKREKAREEGQVAKSQEISTAFLIIFMFASVRIFAPFIYRRLLGIFQHTAALYPSMEDVFTKSYIVRLIPYLLGNTILILAPLLGVALAVGLISNFIQVGWHPTGKPLMPKLSRINPLQGAKRIFSMKALVELVKSVLKVLIISIILYTSIAREAENIFLLLDMSVMEIIQFIGNIAINAALQVGVFFVFLAVGDYIYQRYDLTKQLKMTKQEIKEEHKMVEGNPEIKGKIRQKMREASMRRMMQDIPKADVIITNPTHYAVALQYDREKGMAPIVVAKGMDYLAQRIKDVAKEHRVEIVENRPLARTLYSTVDVGHEIPPELYQTVAEILAFVYSLKKPK